MNGKNRFFVSIMSTLLLEQSWSEPLAKQQSVCAIKVPNINILQTNGSDQISNQKFQKSEKLDYSTIITNQDNMCDQLISLGKKYENQNQLQSAMDCYRAVAVINKKKSQEAISILEAKMQNEIEKNESNEEIHDLEQGARQGNAEDAYELGNIYLKRNEINKAIEMWEIASKYKHPEAPYRLAVIFEKGEIVPLDLAKAESYYKIGSENGHPKCSYIVAKLLELEAQKNPQNTQRIMDQSFKLKQKSADRGHSLAAVEIGYIYASKGDHIKAKRYFEKAYQNAESNSTITLNLKKLMHYHIACEEYQISNSLRDAAATSH